MTEYNIREFRHPITIQQTIKSQDDRGACQVEWKDLLDCHALIKPKTYSSVRGQQAGLDFSVAYDITIRYSDKMGLDASLYRILYGDRVLLLYSILNEEEHNRFIKIIAYQQT